jgi:cation:H+ antiporter
LEILLPVLAVLGGFIALVWAADRFVIGAAAVAHNSGVSPLVIGLTIVGFGTSAPEMLVSSVAAYNGVANLSIGNAVGSNIANIALVLGMAAMVSPLHFHQKVIGRELPVMIVVMIFAAGLMVDGELGRVDGVLLLVGLLVMVVFVVREGLREGEEPPELEELPDNMSSSVALIWILIGLAALLGSSELLVWGATEVATFFDVSERVIGLTVVAFGTSLPELAATLVAAKRGEHDIAVGNVVGSNVFNTLGVLGLPGVIQPGRAEPQVMQLDIPVMIGVSALLWILARALRPYRQIGRFRGALLVVIYVSYSVYLYVGA